MAVSAQASAPRFTKGLCFVGGVGARPPALCGGHRGLLPRASRSPTRNLVRTMAPRPCTKVHLLRVELSVPVSVAFRFPAVRKGLLCQLNTYRHKISPLEEAAEAKEAVFRALWGRLLEGNRKQCTLCNTGGLYTSSFFCP